MEAESEQAGATTFTSPVPTIIGSSDDATFSIESIEPTANKDKVTINATTGVISVASGHGLIKNTEYVINIKVTNKFAPEGVVMTGDNAFKLKVVDYIVPIENFGYSNVTNQIQYTSFDLAPNENMKGSYVVYSFINLASALKGQVTIDQTTGHIKAIKNNTIPVGEYTIQVQAENGKGEPKTTSFTLSVIKNPNEIQYIYYGNNLGLDQTEEASQYRVKSSAELVNLQLTPKTSLDDTTIPIKWKISAQRNMSKATIDENTGKVTLSAEDYITTDAPITWIIIDATAGDGEAARTYRTFIAFDYAVPDKNGVSIEYTPFVFKVNPKTGGTSVAPKVNGLSDISKLVMDYRRSFYFQNLNGPKAHKSGAISTDKKDEATGAIITPADTKVFMNQVWRNYYGKKVPNYGSKDPMSYYTNVNKPGDALGYVDPNKGCAVTINPNKWYGDTELDGGDYANGLMVGQMTYVTNGDTTPNSINNGNKTFSLVVWFDEKF